MKNQIEYIPVTAENEAMCSVFESLMYAYISEMNEHSHRPLPQAFQKKWIDSILAIQGDADRHLELCLIQNAPMGFLYGKVDHAEHHGYVKPGYGYIMEFYVQPDYRRKGYGTAMFRRLEDLFRQDGVERMYLTADPVTGRPFWEAMGFVGANEKSPENQLEIYEKSVSFGVSSSFAWEKTQIGQPGKDEIPITVETVTDLDDDQLIQLEKCFLQEIGESILTEEKKTRLLQAIRCGDITFFLAKQGCRAVGMCSVARCYSTFSCSKIGVLDDFFVEPEFRRKGVARMLTRAAQAWCGENGIASLSVCCAPCDAEMYRALGFEVKLGETLAFLP